MSIQRVRQLVDEILDRSNELKGLVAESGNVGGDVIIPPSDVVRVKPGDNVAAAFDELQKNGGTLLAAPGNYLDVNFVARVRDAATAKPVIIRSDSTNVPREGQRISREYLPALACFQSPNANATFGTENGARRVLFQNVAFGPTPSISRNCVALGNERRYMKTLAETPSDFTFDRVLMFGMDKRGQHQGLRVNAQKVVGMGCAFYDFVEPGRDSQAMGGWNGSVGHVWENCLFEASSENIMYGGSDSASAEMNPRDVLFRRCHFRKDPIWKTWPNGDGSVKAIFEVKNVKNCRVEASIIENNWKDSWPSAVAVCVKVVNQEGDAPWSETADVHIVDTIVRNCGTLFQLQGLDDQSKQSLRLRNINFSNILCYNINTDPAFMGEGKGMPTAVTPDGLYVDHVTMIGNKHSFMNMWFHGGMARGSEVKWTNSVMWESSYGVLASTPFASDAVAGAPTTGFRAIEGYGYKSVDFRGNGIVKGSRETSYPATNARLDEAAVRGSFDDKYKVIPGSALAAIVTTDGKPVGADTDIIRARVGDVI